MRSATGSYVRCLEIDRPSEREAPAGSHELQAVGSRGLEDQTMRTHARPNSRAPGGPVERTAEIEASRGEGPRDTRARASRLPASKRLVRLPADMDGPERFPDLEA